MDVPQKDTFLTSLGIDSHNAKRKVPIDDDDTTVPPATPSVLNRPRPNRGFVSHAITGAAPVRNLMVLHPTTRLLHPPPPPHWLMELHASKRAPVSYRPGRRTLNPDRHNPGPLPVHTAPDRLPVPTVKAKCANDVPPVPLFDKAPSALAAKPVVPGMGEKQRPVEQLDVQSVCSTCTPSIAPSSSSKLARQHPLPSIPETGDIPPFLGRAPSTAASRVSQLSQAMAANASVSEQVSDSQGEGHHRARSVVSSWLGSFASTNLAPLPPTPHSSRSVTRSSQAPTAIMDGLESASIIQHHARVHKKAAGPLPVALTSAVSSSAAGAAGPGFHRGGTSAPDTFDIEKAQLMAQVEALKKQQEALLRTLPPKQRLKLKKEWIEAEL